MEQSKRPEEFYIHDWPQGAANFNAWRPTSHVGTQDRLASVRRVHDADTCDEARAEGERAGQAVSGLLLLIANSLLGRTNTEEEILLSECIRALRSGAKGEK